MATKVIRICDKCNKKFETDGYRISRIKGYFAMDGAWWSPQGEFCSARCAISWLVKRLRKNNE